MRCPRCFDFGDSPPCADCGRVATGTFEYPAHVVFQHMFQRNREMLAMQARLAVLQARVDEKQALVEEKRARIEALDGLLAEAEEILDAAAGGQAGTEAWNERAGRWMSAAGCRADNKQEGTREEEPATA